MGIPGATSARKPRTQPCFFLGVDFFFFAFFVAAFFLGAAFGFAAGLVFGLLPAFTGQGLGKFMLTAAVERAWARGANRVWLHTSSLDHSSALSNYLARGFSIWKQQTYDV